MDDKDLKDGPTEEELEELLEQLKELEEERKNKRNKGKRPKGIIAIEFGGIYHPNRIVHFMFSLLINITLSFTIMSVFQFAEYNTIWDFLLFIVVYSVVEAGVRYYVNTRHLRIVIRTFGMVFYFTYLLLLFILDQYVFVGNFTFTHSTQILAFLTIFVIVRYIIGTAIRRHMRKQAMR